MNDLNVLLDRAAGPVTAPVDARADLTRGHRALSRTRRRRGAFGLVGVAAAGAVGFGVSRVVAPDDDQVTATESHHRGSGVSLLAQPFAAGPFTFDQAPQGWEVQGAYPQGVTIAPIGFADQKPLSFVGKLVILFDAYPPTGEKVELDDRTFWVAGDGGGDSTTIATYTRADEPAGVVRIQYPSGAGWSRDTMLAFLAGVHVGPDARQGQG